MAPVYPQAEIGYTRTKRMLQRADPEHRVWQCKDTRLQIKLINGAILGFRSAEKPDNLYGEDVYAIVVDEATRCRPEAWHALRSTVTFTQAPVRMIGNVKGRKNWVYQLARKAEAGEPDHAYTRITAYDAVEAGILDLAEIEDAKRQLPRHVFKELYLAEAADDEGNPFGIDAIRACVCEFTPAPPVVWGIDLAKSHDWTVAIGLSDQGRVCAFQRWQSDWRNTIARLKAMIDDCPAVIDSTGVGDPIAEQLEVEAGGNLTRFLFTSQSKQRIMEGLASAIHQRRVSFPEGVIVDELESFEYEYRAHHVYYSAPEGSYDDCVCALALAVDGLRERLWSPRMAVEMALGQDADDDDDWQ